MVVPPTLLTWLDMFLLHSSQDHLKVLIVAWSVSTFGSFDYVLWQYLPQLSHDNGVVFFAIVRLYCKHFVTNGRGNGTCIGSTIPL